MILLSILLILTIMNHSESCVWGLVVVCHKRRISLRVFWCGPPHNTLSHLNPWASDVHVVQSGMSLVLAEEGDGNNMGLITVYTYE